MSEDATHPYTTAASAAHHELLRRLGREDVNFAHVVGRIRDAEEAGAMAAEQADDAIAAAMAEHAKWCQIIREAWQREQERNREAQNAR